MAATKSRTTKTVAKSVTSTESATENSSPIHVTGDDVQKCTAKKTYKVRVQLDPYTVVTVKNGFPGMLIYQSAKTGEVFRWEALGDEQDMELQELKNARNASKAFFVNNWFQIDDPEVLDYLGVAEYYKNAINLIDDSALRNMKPSDVTGNVTNLSDGQKLALKYRVKQMIASGDIDSIKLINAFEDALGVELIER